MCRHCRGSGALWNTYVGTWEPCGCDEDVEDGEEADDGPDPDDERDRRMEDDRMAEEDGHCFDDWE